MPELPLAGDDEDIPTTPVVKPGGTHAARGGKQQGEDGDGQPRLGGGRPAVP